jgi:integrase
MDARYARTPRTSRRLREKVDSTQPSLTTIGKPTMSSELHSNHGDDEPIITVENEQATTPPAALVPTRYQTDQNPALVYLASLAASTRRKIVESLTLMANLVHPGSSFENFPWGRLRYQHTQALRAKLAEQYGAATANRHLSALRGTLKEAWRLGQMSAEDYQRAIDLKPVKGSKASQAEKGRHLSPGELTALLAVCDDGTAAGTRDAALIAIAYTCGLRRAELAALQVEDYDQDKQTLVVRHGKGNKERIVPLAPSAADALADWLHIRGGALSHLFTAYHRGDHPTGEGMTDQAIYYTCKAEQSRQE